MGKEVHCYSVPDYASAALAAAVEDIFAQSAAARALGPRSRVLVKPNLVAKHAPEKAVTTHPAVLDAVCAALRRRGVESITVADSPGGLYNPAVMKSIYKASGLLAVCERHGALAYTACEAAPRKTDGVRVKEFSLLRPVLEADFIIDLPKVKTHVMTGMSCAVKICSARCRACRKPNSICASRKRSRLEKCWWTCARPCGRSLSLPTACWLWRATAPRAARPGRWGWCWAERTRMRWTLLCAA